MKTIAFLVFIYALSVSASPVLHENVETRKYPRFVEFPDGKGNFRTVDLEAPVDEAALEDLVKYGERNRYDLYTRRNPHNSQTMTCNDASSVPVSNFNINLPVIVVAHGYVSDSSHAVNPTIRDAMLAKSDVNVIILDWRQMAFVDYTTSVLAVPEIGRALGRFVNCLHSLGVPYSNVHLIGYSLGAHVVGNAGRETGSRVARVTGLDPGGPLWHMNPYRLNANDAVYTEAIHTDGAYAIGGVGIGTPIVQADFFPNGGMSQPGCFTNVCNHDRAFQYYAASVTYNHLIANECVGSFDLAFNTCRGRTFPMGNDDLNKSGFGTYRVNTGSRYPF